MALAAALAASQANAQNLTTTFHGVSPKLDIQGTWNGLDSYIVGAGEMNFTGFDAFCVEPLQGISLHDEVIYSIASPETLASYDKISRLVGAYLSSSRSDADAAAIQWAIWETTNESSAEANVFNGNTRITGSMDLDVANRANEYLMNLDSFTPVTLVYLTNHAAQDVVSWNAIPEPTSLGLAALSGFFLLRRRRN